MSLNPNIKIYSVTEADLPLSCPMPHHVLWNAHPKVFLPIKKNEIVICPYCSNHYTLISQ